MIADSFTADVLRWGVPRLRDLPWRRTRDPWAVLVSEVMLQQTQAPRVVPRWRLFLDRFPTPAACAASSLGDVLREWQGLGYPRRARNLHLTAQRIVERGGFPTDLAGLLELPGVGPYTARALLAFSFEQDAAVVDTNIARVYARVAGRQLTARQVQMIADESLPAGDGWVWNQCLMDLGAVVCRPSSPDCRECPVRSACAWHGCGVPDPAVGSSGVSVKQPKFDGSDRQARGRLMKALSSGPVQHASLARVMRADPDTADRLVRTLVADGLCVADSLTVRLPD
jgi:A/G-specific adenine glycosylase